MKTLRFILLLTLSSSLSLIAQDWKVIESGIPNLVFEIDQEAKGDLYHIRATQNFDISIHRIRSLIEDPTTYSKWLYRYQEAKIDSILSDRFVFRAIVNAPVSLKDRRLKVLTTKQQKVDGVVRYALSNLFFSDNDQYCMQCADIGYLKGYWELIPLGTSKTKVIHEMTISIKAPLPRSIMYRIIKKGPIKSFANLRSYKF